MEQGQEAAMDPEGLAWSGVTGVAKEPLERDWGNSRLSEDLQAWVLSGVWRAGNKTGGLHRGQVTVSSTGVSLPRHSTVTNA